MNQLQLDILDALENGNHTQIQGQLKYGDCFCAEGIICDVLVKHQLGFWDEDDFRYKSRSDPDTTIFSTTRLTLPGDADFGSLTYEDFLLPASSGDFVVNTPLYYFNDSLKQTFPEIAAQLRRKWTESEEKQ